MTATKLRTSAFLIDAYPTNSGLSHTNRYSRLLRNKILSDPSRKIQVYLLTSPHHRDVCGDLNDALPGGDSGDGSDRRSETFVVTSEDEIASFYEAKQRLDDDETRNIQLLCSDARRAFWTQVCQLLLTPVHDWSVIASVVPGGCCKSSRGLAETAERGETVAGDCCPVNGRRCFENGHRCCENEDCAGLRARESPSERAVTVGGGQNGGVFIRQNDAPLRPSTSLQTDQQGPGCLAAKPALDETRLRVQRFLRTLPSLLGPPEADRSEVLLGAGAGFVHGFSTRRGGVTSVSTLCSMNVIYTDRKPDSPLVVEENRRRLATVGGFNHTNFHPTRVEHGHRVWAVGEDPQPVKFDAVVTDRRDVTIAAAGADCIMLIFADPVAMAIGAAHAGWKSSAERVAACVVERMAEEYGSRPEDIRVALGPGVNFGCFVMTREDGRLFSDIHPDCVRDGVEPGTTAGHRIDGSRFRGNGVSPDARRRKTESGIRSESGSEDSASELAPDAGGRCAGLANGSRCGQTGAGEEEADGRRPPALAEDDFAVRRVPPEQLKPKTPRPPRDASRQWVNVDLQLANYHVLRQAGVKAEHIDVRTSHCTACNPELYFSYERDGFPFGNQIGFISMPSSRPVTGDE